MIEYSFIVPVYNDGYLVEPFCVEFEKVFKDYLDLEDIREKVELIFIFVRLLLNCMKVF